MGICAGLLAYWTLYEALPVFAAYRDNRYTIDQAIVSVVTGIDWPQFILVGVRYAGFGGLLGLLFWSVAYRFKRNAPSD